MFTFLTARKWVFFPPLKLRNSHSSLVLERDTIISNCYVWDSEYLGFYFVFTYIC